MTQRIDPVGPRTGTQPVTAPLRLTPVQRDAERRRREEERRKRAKHAPEPDPGPEEPPRQGSVLDIRT